MFRKGVDPGDWRPMSNVGAGYAKIRVRESSGAFRCVYLATRPEGIYFALFPKEDAEDQQDLDWASLNFPDTALMFLAASVANR